MKAKSLSFTLVAGVPQRIYSCNLLSFHNVTINSGTNDVYVGDSSITTGVGLPLNVNDSLNFGINDFQKNDEIFEVWAVCANAATITILAWER